MEDRVKKLEGVNNFRDFGGYDTTDGAHVKKGLLYRAGHFSEATETDIDFINGLSIQFQVDLRRLSERENQPNRWAPTEVHAADDQERREAAHIEYLQRGYVTADESRAFMMNYYREAPFVEQHIDLYRRWFQRLDETGGGALINCAAGKDRTGIGCALTLMALGVDEDTVLADYELTNVAVDLEARLPEVRANMEEKLSLTLSDDAVRPFLGVHSDYLHNAFEAISEAHGSPLGYVTSVLGVDEARMSSLKNKFLE